MKHYWSEERGYREWMVSKDGWLFWFPFWDPLPFKELEPKPKPKQLPKSMQQVKPADQDPSYSHERYLKHQGRLNRNGVTRAELNLRGKLVPPFTGNTTMECLQ